VAFDLDTIDDIRKRSEGELAELLRPAKIGLYFDPLIEKTAAVLHDRLPLPTRMIENYILNTISDSVRVEHKTELIDMVRARQCRCVREGFIDTERPCNRNGCSCFCHRLGQTVA
jgi:hypothetical protein